MSQKKEEIVKIHTPYIQLDQLLKWVGILESGGQIRHMLDNQLITVNNETATEKRKKIRPGDKVVVDMFDDGEVIFLIESENN